MNYIYELRLNVRDYECDLQGIVNNAVYQHYIEHTRSEYLRSKNLSVANLHKQGTDTVVARLEMAFKTPLKPGDSFVSKLAVKKDGLKYIFEQAIFRCSDHQLCFKSTATIVCIIGGKLSDSALLNERFKDDFYSIS